MLFHNCPTCDTNRSSRRQFIAGLGAIGAATALPAPTVLGQAKPKLIDTHLHFYPPDYLSANPTPERLLETVERFEEDLTDTAPIRAPIRAVLEVGEAIEVSPERTRGTDGDPLMAAVREQLETMLAANARRP